MTYVTYVNVSDPNANLVTPAECLKEILPVWHVEMCQGCIYSCELWRGIPVRRPRRQKKCGTPQRRVTWRTDSRIPAGLGAHILSLPPTHTLLRPDLLDLLLINVTVVTRRTGHPVWRVVSDIMCQMFQAHGWILIPKHSSSSCPAALKWWEQ